MQPVEILFMIPDDWDPETFARLIIYEAEKMGKSWDDVVRAEVRPNLTATENAASLPVRD